MKHKANSDYQRDVIKRLNDNLKAFIFHQAVDNSPEEIAKYPEMYDALEKLKHALKSKNLNLNEIVYWHNTILKAQQKDLQAK
jgi:hypothetical protein